MGRGRVLSEVRAMRFEEVLSRYKSGRLSCDEAADVLGMSVSSLYRWRRRLVCCTLALIPSAAIVGMALVTGDPALASKGLMRWAVNVACVVLAGAGVFLVKRSILHRKRVSARATGPL